MIRMSLALVTTLGATAASAQMLPDSPFIFALRDGRASAPLPESIGAKLIAETIQRQTGNAEPVTIEFVRISKFTTQPQCGRIAYTLYQKGSGTYWSQLGGQLNVCNDGSPPLRVCAGSSDLVPAASQCDDGSFPTDTPEIAAATAKATSSGSLTGEQFKAKFAPRAEKDTGKP